MSDNLGNFLSGLVQRKWGAEQARSTIETLAGEDPAQGGTGGGPQGADDGGGFSPVTGGRAGAAPGEDDTSMGMSEQEVQKGKVAEAMRKYAAAIAPEAKDFHTALKGMNYDQLNGMLKAHVMQSTMQEHTAKMQDYMAQAEQRKQFATDDRSIGAAMNRYAALDEVPEGGTSRPATAEDRFRHALSTPGLAGRAVPKLVEALTKYQKLGEGSAEEFFKRGDEAQPVKGAKGWIRVPTGPKMGQLIYAGEDVGVPMPAHDDEGNLVGTVTKDAKGRQKVDMFKGGAKLQPARNAETGEVIPDMYITPQGKVADTRSVIEKQFGEAPGKAAAPSGALPLPKDKKEMKKGQAYQTPQGVYTWDGSKLVKAAK